MAICSRASPSEEAVFDRVMAMLVLLAMACSEETDLERDQAQYLAILSAVTSCRMYV